VDKRRLAEETSCGDSVRQQGSRDLVPQDVQWRQCQPRFAQDLTLICAVVSSEKLISPSTQRMYCHAGQRATPSSVMPINGSPWLNLSGGNENSSGDAQPLCLLAFILGVATHVYIPKPITAECCTCLPVCQSCQDFDQIVKML